MTYHNRHECKFVIGEEAAARVLRRVQPYVAPDPFAAKSPTHTYTIASLYLDDSARSLYRETLGGLAHRYKLRVRSYGDAPAAPIFVEVKRRHDRVVQKLRCPIDRRHLADVLAGRLDVVDGLSPAKQASLREFARLQQLRQAAPLLTVRYERQAYVGVDDDEVRVTFDRRLAALPEAVPVVRLHADGYETIRMGGVVLELKFTDRCPAWMLEVIRAEELRRRSFSKYGTSLEGLRELGVAEA
jgi:hypothetical protein